MKLRVMRRKKYKRYKKLESQNIEFTKFIGWECLKKYESRKKTKHLNNNSLNNIHDRLVLPCKIDFKENINNVELLINRIKKYLQLPNGFTRIDLSKLNKISINGLMFLISEIDTIVNKKKNAETRYNFTKVFKYNPKYGLNKNNDKLKYLLYKIGYWDYFNIKKPYSIPASTEEEYFLNIKSDVLSKSVYVVDLRGFISERVSFLKNEEIQDYFDDAITEAMSNSILPQ